MKFTDKCISITDLRLKTKQCLSDLSTGERYIFVNNKPTAVLVDIDVFEELYAPITVREMEDKDISPALKKKIQEAKTMQKSSFMNI